MISGASTGGGGGFGLPRRIAPGSCGRWCPGEGGRIWPVRPSKKYWAQRYSSLEETTRWSWISIARPWPKLPRQTKHKLEVVAGAGQSVRRTGRPGSGGGTWRGTGFETILDLAVLGCEARRTQGPRSRAERVQVNVHPTRTHVPRLPLPFHWRLPLADDAGAA